MSTARFLALFATCAWVVACKPREPDPEPDPDESPSKATACDADHARAMQAELTQLCPIGLMTAEDNVPLAPWKPAPTPVSHVLRIEVGPGGIVVGATRLNHVLDLQGRLILDRDLANSLGKGSFEWVLVIDEKTSRSDLIAVVKGLIDAGERKGSVMLATSAVPELPKPRDPKRLAELVADVSGTDPSQRATKLAETISNAMPPCPQLVEAFGHVAALAPDDKCTSLATSFSQGLVACGCPKEDELLTYFYMLAVGGEPPTRLNVTLPLTLDPGSAPRSGTTWGEIVSKTQPDDFEAFWVAP